MAGGGINSGSTAAGMTNLWMPPYNTLLYRNQLNNQHQQTAAAYSQHTMFGSANGPPSNSGILDYSYNRAKLCDFHVFNIHIINQVSKDNGLYWISLK